MKVGVLTSSRADYGIYESLLKAIKDDSRFTLEIIAFGMHLQESQGNTLEVVKKGGYRVIHEVGKMPANDGVKDISKGYGDLILAFSEFWCINCFDVVFALGDRWEMSAAIQAAVPFQFNIAHIHGGETTFGAIDNIYRHQITLAAKLHFTANEVFSKRVREIIGSSKGIYTVGALSLSNLESLKLPTWLELKSNYKIPFDDYILVTIHPDSINYDLNSYYAEISYTALKMAINSDHKFIITASNSDVLGSLYNNLFRKLAVEYPENVIYIRSLGKMNYFGIINSSKFLLGNTSSGILEAASFGKNVINIGNRQKGRLRSKNVIDIDFSVDQILNTINLDLISSSYDGDNVYKGDMPEYKILMTLLNDK